MPSTSVPSVLSRPRTPSLLRRHLGTALRRRREQQQRTLRDVAAAAGVSLGYLSEVERGVKEASSELLSAICRALDVRLPDLLVEVADALYRLDVATSGVPLVGIQVGRAPVGASASPPDAVDARAA
ncbi:MAG TPA: helix-turn-helix transcriptional regulator [Mycobacteriales bacterium]|nr:helix-turn-helix transcriptional regulator [Mycobacteriales bacterium]